MHCGAYQLEVFVTKVGFSLTAGHRQRTQGAVMVEFLAVFFPLLIFFLGLIQLGFVQSASIVVNHAAMKAARVASMVSHDDPKYYGGAPINDLSPGSPRRVKIDDAARLPLATIGNPASATIKLNKNGGGYARDELITVTVNFTYTCAVPFVRVVWCNGGKLDLMGEASLPNQGADFIY
jgi:hypothetical protein